MIRFVRALGVVVGASSLLMIPVATGQGVAMAQASCGGTTVITISSTAAKIVPSTSNGSGNYNCIAGQGTTGDGVVTIQRALDFCKGEKLAIDGIYGPLTAGAVKRQQAREGVPADGTYGPVTRSHGFPMIGISTLSGEFCTTAGF